MSSRRPSAREAWARSIARDTRLDRNVAIRLLPPTPITYRQLTFQRGFISAARFAPDGHTILYSASWGDEPMRIYSTRSDGMESQPLSVPNAKLLSATVAGEMTILVRPYELGTW